MFELVTQLNCEPVTLQKFIKRWVMKCKGPGDEREAENSVFKMKSFFVEVKIPLFSSVIVSCKCIVSSDIPNTGVLGLSLTRS